MINVPPTFVRGNASMFIYLICISDFGGGELIFGIVAWWPRQQTWFIQHGRKLSVWLFRFLPMRGWRLQAGHAWMCSTKNWTSTGRSIFFFLPFSWYVLKCFQKWNHRAGPLGPWSSAKLPSMRSLKPGRFEDLLDSSWQAFRQELLQATVGSTWSHWIIVLGWFGVFFSRCLK